jgi:hypothetical protein
LKEHDWPRVVDGETARAAPKRINPKIGLEGVRFITTPEQEL